MVNTIVFSIRGNCQWCLFLGEARQENQPRRNRPKLRPIKADDQEEGRKEGRKVARQCKKEDCRKAKPFQTKDRDKPQEGRRRAKARHSCTIPPPKKHGRPAQRPNRSAHDNLRRDQRARPCSVRKCRKIGKFHTQREAGLQIT